MRTAFLMSLACCALAPADGKLAVAQDTKPDRHNWSEITYPRLPAAKVSSLVPGFVLRNGKADGMRFIVSYTFDFDDKAQKKLPPIEKIAARLHSSDGKITDGKREGIGGQGGLGMIEYEYEFCFPWRLNLLEEAWIEVRLPQQTYWVEVPYGFTRNPADPLKLTEARRGRPKFPPTVKIGKKDWLVPWFEVQYEVVPVRDNSSVRLNISNPHSPSFEVILYSAEFRTGKDGQRGRFDSPHTELEIKFPGEGSIVSKRMSTRLSNDEMQRHDGFRLDEEYEGIERCWGTITVKVDKKGYDCVVPSSLVWVRHGMTDARDHYRAVVPRLREH